MYIFSNYEKTVPGRMKKIMVVDDNSMMREMLKRVVDPFAKELFEYDNGEDAVTAFTDVQPDVVLMDIRMEGMDGIVATRKILEQYPDAKIIIVTDYGDEVFQDAAKNAGAAGYVLKENLFELRTMLV
ncbi:MAG: response regulator [Bacteroidetes bacterium]|nr:MAG: response regulator [Bacteroidota bacterium]